jgi:hypothetical protein
MRLARPSGTWNCRPKTITLADGFSGNLQGFLSCFPGFVSPDHGDRVLRPCLIHFTVWVNTAFPLPNGPLKFAVTSHSPGVVSVT